MDIKAAFCCLDWESQQKEIYISQPNEAKTNKLRKLKTKVYGLCDVELGVDTMMQYFIGIKKTPYKVLQLHTLMTFVGQEQNYFKIQ